MIWHILEPLVIRGRKPLHCYHNCSCGGQSLTQDVNPSVMERPLLAQRLGPHGPLPQRNIHQRVRTSRPTPEMSHQHQQRCGERSCRGPRGKQSVGGGATLEDQDAKIKRRMNDGCDLKPTSPPSASAVITALTLSVQKKYDQRFLSGTFHQKPLEDEWEVTGLCLFSHCILSLVFQPPPHPRLRSGVA